MIQANYGFSPQYLGNYGQFSSQASFSGTSSSSSSIQQSELLQQLFASLAQSSRQLQGQWSELLGTNSSNSNQVGQFPPPPPPNGQFGGQQQWGQNNNSNQFPPPPPPPNGQFGGQQQWGQDNNSNPFPPPPPGHHHRQNNQNSQNDYDLAALLQQLGLQS